MTLLRKADETGAFIQFGELSYYTAYAHAVRLQKIHLEEDGERWRARIKGLQKGVKVVAYLTAPSYTALVLLVGSLSDKDCLRWYRDRYP